MPLVILAVGIALLLLLMLVFKLNGFISLILVAVVVGLLQGLPFISGDSDEVTVMSSVVDGVGGQVDDLILILGFGAMLGVLMADMGAANRLATTLIRAFGVKRAQLAIVIVAFLVGVVLFWETAWIILIPIVFAVARQQKLPIMWLAMPLAIALSSMHSFLPPHPGPTAVAGIYEASIGKTLLFGLIIALPVGLAVALVWPRLSFVRNVTATAPEGLVSEKEFTDETMPSFGVSLGITALPILLIAGSAIFELAFGEEHVVTQIFAAIGDAPVALLIGLLVAICYFALVRRVPMDTLMSSCSSSIKSIAMIIFIIGAGGAFKQVLQAGGISDYIIELTGGWDVSPIILAWAIAALMRIALGSASVAVVAAAGIAQPLVASGAVSPELMVLATACGSVIASHLNDPGFWMFKEFLGLSVKDTLKVRTTYTTVLAILGLAGCLILSLFIQA
ncbi:gluconate:H+ symporter [Propionibacterium australiense]|uniref:Gluconate permease n=1 Tax=Propionibacterium australiense TaxID=119981 RepID=A0A383S3K6_9ACTN|nr:gluconate:H+ symporter [Propionibacterium australiense]RLP11446.1 gluconate permease [Propionibacterium australiense]RLP12818.1 gluconate permease [Propionibacterium australiense]SYZ32142.1 gntP: transporter, gluconate:H+ symporter (GntP) family [Propionibacterium australiense]VEH90814.1 Gnt-I system [Propionibacterium australiense]